jgi:hypothetical protein
MALKSKPLDQVRADVPVQEVADSAPGGELVRVAFAVDKATRKAWQFEALERDTTLSEMMREAMREYLENHPRT